MLTNDKEALITLIIQDVAESYSLKYWDFALKTDYLYWDAVDDVRVRRKARSNGPIPESVVAVTSFASQSSNMEADLTAHCTTSPSSSRVNM